MTIRGDHGDRQAKQVQSGSNPAPPSLEDFRSQIGESLERILRAHKAEVVAGAVDRKRSTLYRWAASPEDVPFAVIPALSIYDPDPEYLPRLAGLLLSIHAQRALARQAQGRTLMVFHEIAPGRWGR